MSCGLPIRTAGPRRGCPFGEPEQRSLRRNKLFLQGEGELEGQGPVDQKHRVRSSCGSWDPGFLIQVQGAEARVQEEASRRQHYVMLNKACQRSRRSPRANGTEDSGSPRTSCVSHVWTQH